MNLKTHATDLWNEVVSLAKLVVSSPAGLRTEIGLIVTAAVSFGLLNATKASAEADAITALILLIAAVVTGAERLIQAFKSQPAGK